MYGVALGARLAVSRPASTVKTVGVRPTAFSAILSSLLLASSLRTLPRTLRVPSLQLSPFHLRPRRQTLVSGPCCCDPDSRPPPHFKRANSALRVPPRDPARWHHPRSRRLPYRCFRQTSA